MKWLEKKWCLVRVKIHQKTPDVKKLTFISSEPQIVTLPETPLYVKEGGNILLQVQVMGSPAPSHSWYFNDVEVTEDYSLRLAQDGTLTIPSAEPRHSGAYRLVAANTADSVSKEVHVIVLGDEEPNPLAPKVSFRPIPLPEFGEYVAVNHTNSDQGFMEQYTVTDCGYNYAYDHVHSCILQYPKVADL